MVTNYSRYGRGRSNKYRRVFVYMHDCMRVRMHQRATCTKEPPAPRATCTKSHMRQEPHGSGIRNICMDCPATTQNVDSRTHSYHWNIHACIHRAAYVLQSPECTPEMYAAQRAQRKAEKKAWLQEKEKLHGTRWKTNDTQEDEEGEGEGEGGGGMQGRRWNWKMEGIWPIIVLTLIGLKWIQSICYLGSKLMKRVAGGRKWNEVWKAHVETESLNLGMWRHVSGQARGQCASAYISSVHGSRQQDGPQYTESRKQAELQSRYYYWNTILETLWLRRMYAFPTTELPGAF